MQVKLASRAGFCFGVKRALQIAHRTLTEARQAGAKVYTLGPLVHNANVIHNLQLQEIEDIESLGLQAQGILIIRSHGISPSLRQQALSKGFRLIDATCPLVQKIHDTVESLNKEGFKVIVVGNPAHPEVQGIIGYAPGNCYIVEKESDIEALPQLDKIGIVEQTTVLNSRFEGLLPLIQAKARISRVFNTICFEALKRQEETRALAQEVEAMVVVGGKNSSNTRRLVEICASCSIPTYHIENEQELENCNFSGIAVVGLTAGASTPPEIIERVQKRLEKS
jgi:(E)-4-hydroxy-3-methyl-but-2-enyl pyrophosphate reductase